MKALELKHLVGYLPFKVLVGDGRTQFELTVDNFTNVYKYITEIYLHPLSDLIKESEEIEDSLILQIINSLPNTCGAYIDWLDSCIYNEIRPDNLLQAPHELILELQKRHFWIYDQSAFKNGLIVDINTLK